MRELKWYKHLVFNRTVLGSLFTLLHLPFLFAFLSLAIIGAFLSDIVNLSILYVSLCIVFLLLWGEHMLDDTTVVGKPWETVFNDAALFRMAAICFVAAIIVGGYGCVVVDHIMPVVIVGIGCIFCSFYGLEIWKFHSLLFGSLAIGLIAVAALYLQTLSFHAIMLPIGIFGFSYGYIMLSLYEHTKTIKYEFAWKTLGLCFIMIYALGFVMIMRWL